MFFELLLPSLSLYHSKYFTAMSLRSSHSAQFEQSCGLNCKTCVNVPYEFAGIDFI